MTRWSRSRLRAVGIAAVATLGGSLVVAIPTVSHAGPEPAPARPAVAADRIAMIAGAGGRSAFQFQPGSGDRNAPFGFVSTGGTVRVQQFGGESRPPVQARTGAPVRAAKATAAAAYRTTITVDSQNWTAWGKLVNLWNRDTWTYVPVTNPPNSLSATANLPPGNYYVTAMYGIYGLNSYLLTKAFTVTDKAQTVRLAEKSAKEVAIRVDDKSAQQSVSAAWMSLPNGDLVGFAGGPQTRTYVTTASTAGTTLRMHQVLTKAGASALRPSPYRYALVRSWPHPLPPAPVATVRTSSLARTTTAIRAQGTTTDASFLTVPRTGEWTGVYLSTPVRVPATITEYVTPGVTMSRIVHYGTQSLYLPDRSLPAGMSPGATVGAGPLVPGRRWYDDDSWRYRNWLQVTENMTLGDAAGNKGADTWDTTSMTLSSGGQVLKAVNTTSLSVEVPQSEQTYQLAQTSTRKVPWSQLSTKIQSEWTFVSAGPTATHTTLPLMDLAVVASGLDQRNRAGSAPVGLTIKPSTRQLSAKNTVDTVEWSIDDGATWAHLPLTASGEGVEASLPVPATASFVSLRVTASNDAGGALRRTVLRALAGPATAGDELVGGTTISNVKVNGGKAIVVGTSGSAEFTATFTASDPSGIVRGGLYLWHGPYNTPDGLQTAHTECVSVSTTSSTCTSHVYMWDVRYLLASNALAGAWRAEAWAAANDGTGFTDRRAAGSVAIKRATTLTGNAAPEPVKKGRTITVTGALTRADWSTWTYRPYASQPVALQWKKVHTSTWATVKTVKTDANGRLKTTVPAKSDGSYRFSFAGDPTSNLSSSAADYVNVQ